MLPTKVIARTRPPHEENMVDFVQDMAAHMMSARHTLDKFGGDFPAAALFFGETEIHVVPMPEGLTAQNSGSWMLEHRREYKADRIFMIASIWAAQDDGTDTPPSKRPDRREGLVVVGTDPKYGYLEAMQFLTRNPDNKPVWEGFPIIHKGCKACPALEGIWEEETCH